MRVMSAKKSVLVVYPDQGRVDRIMPTGELRRNVGTLDTTGYLRAHIDGKAQHIHRVVFERAHGPIPKGFDVDHINEIKTDNRLLNLRLVNRSQNMQNTRRARAGSSSNVKGVSFCKLTKKWRAQITSNYKMRYLGLFDSKESAAEFYGLAASMLHTHNPLAAKE